MLAEVANVGQQLYANPMDREDVLHILKEKGIMAPRELAVIHRDGTRFYVLVSAREIRDSKGNLQCYQAEHIDITERKQTEAALNEREELYRQAVSSISDAVFLTDDLGNFDFACSNANLTFGWSEADVMAMGNISALVGRSPISPPEMGGELRNVEGNRIRYPFSLENWMVYKSSSSIKRTSSIRFAKFKRSIKKIPFSEARKGLVLHLKIQNNYMKMI
jgi:PAS domain-containing protein